MRRIRQFIHGQTIVEEEKLIGLVQASAALEGCTLDAGQCGLLLREGVSSAGKTIAEQLLCMDLRDGYICAGQLAGAHEFWSAYRIRSVADRALRNSGGGVPAPGTDAALQKICGIANTRRLHISEARRHEIYRASFEIHYLVSQWRIWGALSDMMGRLLMNWLQFECGLEPTVVRKPLRKDYKRILEAATAEEIGEIFVSFMSEHEADPEEAVPEQAVPKGAVPKEAPAPVPPKPSSREQILTLLKAHPWMSTRDLAGEIGISAKGVEKQLGILKEKGALRRVGPDKGGVWEVL